MEIITALAVNLLTSGLKKVTPVVANLSKPALRLLVAVFALIGSITVSALTGAETAPMSIETFVEAIKVFAISQGAFFLTKSK